MSRAARCEKLSFFPWVCRTSFPGRPARRLRLIQKEGPLRGCVESQRCVTRLNFRCKEKRGQRKEGKKPSYTVLSMICGPKEWSRFLSLSSVGGGKCGCSARPEQHRIYPQLAGWRWPELGAPILAKRVRTSIP